MENKDDALIEYEPDGEKKNPTDWSQTIRLLFAEFQKKRESEQKQLLENVENNKRKAFEGALLEETFNSLKSCYEKETSDIFDVIDNFRNSLLHYSVSAWQGDHLFSLLYIKVEAEVMNFVEIHGEDRVKKLEERFRKMDKSLTKDERDLYIKYYWRDATLNTIERNAIDYCYYALGRMIEAERHDLADTLAVLSKIIDSEEKLSGRLPFLCLAAKQARDWVERQIEIQAKRLENKKRINHNILLNSQDELKNPKVDERFLENREKILFLLAVCFGKPERPEIIQQETVVKIFSNLTKIDMSDVRKIIKNPTGYTEGDKNSLKRLINNLTNVHATLIKLAKSRIETLSIANEIQLLIEDLNDLGTNF